MIRSVFIFENGMTAVFDENKQQIPEFQGPWSEVFQEVLHKMPVDAEFKVAQKREFFPKVGEQWVQIMSGHKATIKRVDDPVELVPTMREQWDSKSADGFTIPLHDLLRWWVYDASGSA